MAGTLKSNASEPLRLPRPRSVGLINPPAGRLGLENAVLSGTSTLHLSGEVEGWLSIKTAVCGSAVWETAERSFTVDENCYLILNDRHRYTLRIDSPQNVTTFCLFFRRGFVEDVMRCEVTPSARLLDDPQREAGPVGFFERLESRESPLLALVRRFQWRLERAPVSTAESDDWFTRLAGQMVREHQKTRAVVGRLPGLRPATRLELYRRVLRGRDFLLSNTDQRVTLDQVARAACLSPYHFHRAFRRAFTCSPHDYLTQQRVNRAGRLLIETDRSVTDICLDAGFESLGSFSSLFRRRCGVSPREFRRASGKIRKIEEELLPAST